MLNGSTSLPMCLVNLPMCLVNPLSLVNLIELKIPLDVLFISVATDEGFIDFCNICNVSIFAQVNITNPTS